MENQTFNALDYYKQSKQRVDIDIDFQNKKILGKTNLTFLLKEEIKLAKQPETLILKLNSDNMIIKSTNILIYSKSNTNNLNSNLNPESNNIHNNNINYFNQNNFSKKNSCAVQSHNNASHNIISLANPNLVANNNNNNAGMGNYNCFEGNSQNLVYSNHNGENQQNQVLKKLKFGYISPENYLDYLKSLYNCVEDSESIKNLNRIEWESKIDGSLIIEIPYSYLIESSTVSMSDEVNEEKIINKLQDKFKIMIEYELYSGYAGIVFQNFYDEKIDSEYDVCYTPNFYYNTANWIPCIYSLTSHILWRLYILVSHDYCVYSSCQINRVYQDSLRSKKAFFFKSKEPLTAKNIGFIAVYEKIFTRLTDNQNKNIIYVINDNKRDRVEKNFMSNGLINSIYSFYEEFFESDSNNLANANISSNTVLVLLPYLVLNSSEKLDRTAKKENYFNLIKFPNLYIMPEKLIYNDTIPDIMEFQLKNLGKIFITNYIGGLINEADFSDFWLINGIENWLSDCFLLKCFGNNFMKNRIYRYLKKFKKISKYGKEKKPLYTNMYSHPVELQLDPINYLKSTLVMHMLENQVEKIFVQKALKNIINERFKNGYNISTESFIKIFKKNCGISLKNFMNIWICKTGMLEVSIKYNYNKRTNSVDIDITQNPISKNFFENYPYFKIKDLSYEILNKLGRKAPVVDFRMKAIRFFDVNFNLYIYQTNGIEVMRDIHQIKLENERESVFQNIPLIAKIRRIPIKKREQEFIQELIGNTSISKLYSNEDIEKILTQNSIMWIKADSDISILRQVNCAQQHIIYDYIKLFKENDIVGQYETLKNIFKSEENYANSLVILETFIRSQHFYALRIYAMKIFIKINLKMKQEDGYIFLLEFLEDCYADVLKNKTQLNRDSYFIMKKIIKFLGEYKEENFNEFFIIGKVNNSSIQNKIIDKFLTILISNDLNIINGFNDSYIMREILLGCAKLNLQEKTFFLLKKIVKCMRIEKLKRSFNEIIIVSSIEAFLIVLVKNDFFVNEKKNSFNKSLIDEILGEINHYLNSDCENYELRLYLSYFEIYLKFYKSKDFSVFSGEVFRIILDKITNIDFFGAMQQSNANSSNNGVNNGNLIIGESERNVKEQMDMSENSISISNPYLNKIAKKVDSKTDFDFESIAANIYAFYDLMNVTKFAFEQITEKLDMMYLVKEIIQTPLCYLRIDLRTFMEKIYAKILGTAVEKQNQSNNIEALFNHAYGNKHLNNFMSRRYADETWLYSFIKDDRKDNYFDFSEFKKTNNLHSENSSETHSRMGISSLSLKRKYQRDYPDDKYFLMNSYIDFGNKDWRECANLILDKLMNHPVAYPFVAKLDKEYLGELYDHYYSIIKNPIDFITISERIADNIYSNINEFFQDVMRVFSNCRKFNEKGSEFYDIANQIEEYYKILIKPMTVKNYENISRNQIPEIKIKLSEDDNINID